MITKKDCEILAEIQSEAQADIEFLESLFDEIDKIISTRKNFKIADMSLPLQDMLNLRKSKLTKYQAFIKELTQLSKDYGVAIKSVGGVHLGEIKKIEYRNDETSGDLIPNVEWA